MDQNQDFTALRNLLALKRFDLPKDTQIDQFLTEFHTRQRAQLLARPSLFAQATAWIQEKVAGFQLVPSLSYGAAFAAIAITAFVGLSQQVQVTEPGHPFQLSLRMNPHDGGSFAIIPASFGSSSTTSTKATDSLNFTPTRPSDSATTRFVLANNTHGVHDTSVTF